MLLEKGGGVAALARGLVITGAVKSSSITTSVLVPLAAAGVISVRNVYPVALDDNIGTTVTALLAAMAASRPEALTIALVHTRFNLAGTLLFYPVPFMREIPIRMAERVALVGKIGRAHV